MRVTKTIKEYIEKRVKAIMPTTTPEEEAYETERRCYEDFRKRAEEKLKAYASELIAEFYEESGIAPNETFKIKPNGWMGINYEGQLPSCAKANCAKNKRVKETNEAIENIIVTLELGGTRAELEEMLNNLRGE